MSGVYARLRKKTEVQFLVTAWELQKEITKFVMSEKNIPKKWRYMVGQDIIHKVLEFVDNLNYANCLFPTNLEECSTRIEYQQRAIANIWQLQNKLVLLIEAVDEVKIEKMEKIIELLEFSERLVKQWKKSDKERFKKLFAV